VVAPVFGWLLGLRIVQGLAAEAGMMVSRAILRDLCRLDPLPFRKYFQRLSTKG